MEQAHKVLFVLIGIAIVAVLLGWRSIPPAAPALVTADADHPDAMILGDSTPRATTTKGPDYLTANVPLFFPAPLAHLNPITSGRTV